MGVSIALLPWGVADSKYTVVGLEGTSTVWMIEGIGRVLTGIASVAWLIVTSFGVSLLAATRPVWTDHGKRRALYSSLYQLAAELTPLPTLRSTKE